MNKELIYLCDLTHTSQGYAAELTPYPIACLKSYLLQYSRFPSRFTVEIFKHPQYFIDAFLKGDFPAIVGFSNYMWNLDLSCQIAAEIKSRSPETLIVFGGPNFPLEDHRREAWLRKFDVVDAYLIGEAEESFTNLADVWYENHSVQAILDSGIQGCHALVNGSYVKSDDTSPRVEDLSSVPSPYLMGHMDEFLKEVPLTPLLETNRGCPFTCTFCVDGIADRTKVYRKSLDRFEEELKYIAQRYEGKVLTLADLNFGMYVQDLEACRAIARIKTKYGYPYHLQVTTGKNQSDRVLDCGEILEGSLRLGASVQSLDPDVLINVRRESISTEKLIEVTKRANSIEANSYSEVILGLPGDTKEKHFNTVFRLADAELRFIPLYTLMMLAGTQLDTDESREKWQLGFKYRVVPRCFGAYQFGDKEILSTEVEEVCVYTNTLPYDDYAECRSLALTMGLFYQDRILWELYAFLKNFGVLASDLLAALHERKLELGEGIADLYRSFEKATEEELWGSREELEQYSQSGRDVIESYVAGELGNNVLFRHRAAAFLGLVDEIHEAVYGVAAELLQSKDRSAYEQHRQYLEELRVYSTLRKRNVFDLEARYAANFTYDFQSLLERDFSGLPRKLAAPVDVSFYSTEDTKEMIKFEQYVQGSDLNGIAKIVSRVPCTKLQRAVTFGGEDASEGFEQKDNLAVNLPLSPGEFT